MSVQATSWVWDHSDSDGNARLVLLAIADAANREGEMSCQSVPTLMRMTHLSESTVYRMLKGLRDSGEVEQTGLHPKYRTAIYRLPLMTDTPVRLTGSQNETPVSSDTGPLSPVTPNPSLTPSSSSISPEERSLNAPGAIVSEVGAETHPSRQITTDWAPRPVYIRWLMHLYGMPYDEIRESGRRFVAHHLSRGDTSRSWEALFLKWVSTDAERRRDLMEHGTDDLGVPHNQRPSAQLAAQPGDDDYVSPEDLLAEARAVAERSKR